jgi:hypothetical protein
VGHQPVFGSEASRLRHQELQQGEGTSMPRPV